MSEEEKTEVENLLAQFSADVEDARKATHAARDSTLAEIDQVRSLVASSKIAFDTAATDVTLTKSQVDAAKATAIADIEQASSAVMSAKASAEAAAAEVDKLKTAIATAKGSIDADQKNASTDAAIISGAKKDVEKFKADAIVQRDALTTENAVVNGRIADLQKSIKPLEEELAALTEIKSGAEAERTAVTEAVNAITNTRTTFETLNTQALQKHTDLTSQYGALDDKISAITEAFDGIDALKKSLLVDDGDKISIRTSINALRDQISTVLRETSDQRDSARAAFDESQKRAEEENAVLLKSSSLDFEQLHKRLEREIRALLPSAGAAGLASTYYDAKSRYAWTSFAGKPGSDVSDVNRGWFRSSLFWLRTLFGYNPTNLFSTTFFYILFIVPILGIVWIFYPVVRDLPTNALDKLDIKIVVLRFLIALPLAAISAFGVVSLNLYRRLYEEFNHKQRVMELYGSFQKEVAEGGTAEQKEALLSVMIDTVSDRAYLAKGAIEGKGETDGTAQDGILSQLNGITRVVTDLAKAKN